MKETAPAAAGAAEVASPGATVTPSSGRRAFTPARALAGWAVSPFRWCGAALRRLARRPRRALAVGILLALIGLGASVVGVQLWALYRFRAGRSALERYHNAEAQQHLQACVKVWPRDPATVLLAGRAARRMKAFDQAEQYLDRYQSLRGEDDDMTLERVLLRAERGEVDAVAKFCRALVDQDHPGTPLILEALAA